MDNQILKVLFSKKTSSATKLQLTQELVHEYCEPVNRACKQIAISRTHYNYETKKGDSEEINVFSKGELAIEVDTSLSSQRGIRTVDKIILQRRTPVSTKTDNSPEFTSKDLELWSLDKGIKLKFIQLGMLMQNSYIECFNRIYCEAILDAYLFFDLNKVRVLTEE